MGKASLRKSKRKKEIPLTPEIIRGLEAMRREFREKFGRDPSADDPVFFDPREDSPKPLSAAGGLEVQEEIARAMEKAGIDFPLIHAYRKTGILLTEANADQFSEADLQEYDRAFEEGKKIKSESTH
jgi:integrase